MGSIDTKDRKGVIFKLLRIVKKIVLGHYLRVVVHRIKMIFSKAYIDKVERGISSVLIYPVSIFTKIIKPSPKLKNDSPSVLILMEGRFWSSTLNRVKDIAEFLKDSSMEVKYLTPFESVFGYINLDKYNILVFQRVGDSALAQKYIERAKHIGIKLVYECDDLIFHSKFVPYFHPKSEFETKFWNRKMRLTNTVFEQCDYYIASTKPISEEIKSISKNKSVYIIPNGVNDKYLSICKNLSVRSKKDPLKVIIGYMSGTPTHNHDFEVISDSMISILSKNPNVYLHIIGNLKLNDAYKEFSSRTIHSPLQMIYNMPKIVNNWDINLAPLVLSNPFNEGKSSLKFVYAALQHIPTVASSTQPFREAIIDSENGFLAEDSNKWTSALQKLIDNNELRMKIGNAAYETAVREFTARKLSKIAQEVFQKIFES